ncbi:MAG: glycosyltransferase family 4 protein [Methanosarcinales archaeon]|nr:glycosyltransferase family 4 protein [Methanosarcinales archaeon]
MLADATSVHTQRWASYFVQQGDEVHLITYEAPGKPIEGVELHVVRSMFHSLYLAFIPRHLRIYFLIRKIKPDIVHAHFISKFGFHAAFLGFHPVVMSAWGDDILIIPYWSKFLWYFTKISLKGADKIYAVSEDMAEKITSNFGIPANNVVVVPFGVDTELFQPAIMHKQESSGRTIVFSNRNFLEVYNIETLINAIPLVIEKNINVHFVIKGSGPLEESLKELVSTLNVDEYVTFVGWTEYHNMPEYLHNCDIYVSTAISDGTPVSVLEAMACGKACIVTDVGGVSEWIEDDVCGSLIPPQKPQILAENILELVRNPAKREVLGKEAHRIVIERGDWYNIMKWVRDDYKTLVREHGIQ